MKVNEIIRLSQNENPLGPSPRVKKALLEDMSCLSIYPPANGEPLTEALAKKYALNPERIALSNGSGSFSILLMIAEQFTTGGGKVMFSEQGFVNFIFGMMQRAEILDMPFEIIPKQQHHHNLDLMVEKARHGDVRVIFIENPDNPTGTWISHDNFSKFMAAVPEHILVVLDGAYSEYASYALGAEYPDVLKLQEKHSNLVSVRTFSKAYGLAGLRVGYAIANARIFDRLNQRRMKLSVASPALVATCAALQDQHHLQRTLEFNSTGMNFLETSFQAMGVNYVKSAANFIMFDVPGECSAALCEKLKQRGVLLMDLSPFNLHGKLRVSTGLPDQNQVFVENLQEIIGRNRKANLLVNGAHEKQGAQ